MTGRFLLRLLPLLAIVAVAATAAALATQRLPFLAAVEAWLEDYRVATLLPAEPQDPRLVIVAITDETLSRFPYREPIDRHFLAELLRTLEERGVNGILLDVLFDQPTEADKDEELKRTLAGLKVPLVVSYGDTSHGLTENQASFLNGFVPPHLRGYANLVTAPLDGTVRWLFPGALLPDGGFVPGVAPALAAQLGIKTDRRERLIRWHGRPDSMAQPFPSFRADLVKVLPPSWLSGKIVLVGADLALSDRHRTPFSTITPGQAGNLPGIVIHAHALAQLLDGRNTRLIDGPLALVLVALAALAGSLLSRLPINLWLRLPLTLLVLLALWAAAFTLFQRFDLMLPLIAPSLALALAQWLTDLYFGGLARRQRRFIEQAFGRYLSRDLVRQLMNDPTRLRLGGERRELTILVTDIAGFTSLAERLAPETVSVLLNTYFEGVCRAVLEHGGMVNEFLGDSVLAFFGAPLAQDDHCARALAAARAIDAFAERFRRERIAEGIAFGATRIGVHGGVAMVGNFGSHERFKYVALGDTVNTASRLEGLNKHFGTRLLTSGPTLAGSAPETVRPLGAVVLKGRHEALPVFELLSAEAQAEPWLTRYRAAFALMEAGAAEALAAFAALAAEVPGDPVIALHHQRLSDGANDAVVVMTEK